MGKQPNITPTEGYILLEAIDDKTPNTGFLVVNDSSVRPQKATVLAVGGDTYYQGTAIKRQSPVNVGDIVMHSSYGYEAFKIDSKEYYICPFDKILGVYGKS